MPTDPFAQSAAGQAAAAAPQSPSVVRGPQGRDGPLMLGPKGAAVGGCDAVAEPGDGREEFRRFCAEFGEKTAGLYYAKGLSFDEARAVHTKGLVKQVGALELLLKQLGGTYGPPLPGADVDLSVGQAQEAPLADEPDAEDDEDDLADEPDAEDDEDDPPGDPCKG